MKKTVIIILGFFFLTSILSGCLTTLFPIFHEKNVVFNSTLLGLWRYTEDEQEKFMEFNKIPGDRKKELTPNVNNISDKGYLVSTKDSTGKLISQCFVFLAMIGPHYYLDYYPAEIPGQKKVNVFHKEHFIKVHASYRIDFKNRDHFEMKMFDKSFLDKLIANNKINIRHEVVDGKNIITAPTDDLQKFIIQYSDNPKAFTKEKICKRVLNY